VLLLFLIGLCAPTQVGAQSAHPLRLRAEARAVPTAVAGPGVKVRCTVPPADVTLAEAFGHADPGTRSIELAPSICRALNGLVTTPARPSSPASFAQARALLVLVHESVHVSDYSGRDDEALTECRAIQLVAENALVIGVSEQTARALGHEAMRYDARLPGPADWRVGLGEIPSYHAPDCGDGGPLDIHPESSDWPN
jgi:hypothetical protein